MTNRFWVIGGEYRDAGFTALVPGTESMAGPYSDVRRARTEWERLSRTPRATAYTRYAIAAEARS